ncbi:hypothetical protein [Roseateles sp.]|uniref:hypothetical protein n=1 Tax=Roseateles sp. TaxID=1971397 RepID=UPI0031DCF15D
MAPEMVTFWLAGTCPPMVGWILNLTIRGPTALKTSVADWALLLLVFDGTAAISLQDIFCNIPNEAVRAFIPAIAPALILVSTAIWMVIVRWLEPVVAKNLENPRDLIRKSFCASLMWILVLMNIFGHYFLFIRGFHVD